MKKLFYFIVLMLSVSGILTAQTVKEELDKHPELAIAYHHVYQLPKKALTPAPKGEKPFYLSHFGRHGSRYMCSEKDYTRVLTPMREADKASKLTPLGKETLQKLEQMYAEAKDRAGELTQIGANQHRGIAHRMYMNFPEVFKGNVVVDAKSSDVIRCILSMENEMMEFARLNPQLNIKTDASKHDLYYIKGHDKNITKQRDNDKTKAFLGNWEDNNVKPERFIRSLFNDDNYVEYNMDKKDFYRQMFELATILQNSELGKTVSMYDLYTKDEIYTFFTWYNMGWFMSYGPCELNGGVMPKMEMALLNNIIEEADSCIQLEHPGATMRFAHDTNVLPFVCLLNLNGYGNKMMPTELEKNNWIFYNIVPMACNVQLIFYKKNSADKDVLVKILLNEEEATLPIKSVSGPYYKWSDVRKYFKSL